MLYSEIYGMISVIITLLALIIAIFIFNPLRESDLNKKEIFLLVVTLICSLSLLCYSTTFPARIDLCKENGYDKSGIDGDDEFCSRIENGTKITYYYDEYEIRDWEKQQLNKED